MIDLQTQLRNFEEVRKSLAEKLGEKKAKKLISEAIYFISIGSNDYIGGYLGNPKMQESYNPEQYVGIVIGNLTQAIQVRFYLDKLFDTRFRKWRLEIILQYVTTNILIISLKSASIFQFIFFKFIYLTSP